MPLRFSGRMVVFWSRMPMLKFNRVLLQALAVAFALGDTLASAPPGRSYELPPSPPLGAGEVPYVRYRVHRVGAMGLNVTNFAYLGGRKDDCLHLAAEAIEFPLNSSVEYNFAGGLWVGAVVNGDTLVSLAINGNSGGGGEFFPRKYPEGDFIERTTRPVLRQPANSFCPDVYFSEDAVSEQDFVCMYCDTLGEDLGLGGEETPGIGPSAWRSRRRPIRGPPNSPATSCSSTCS